MKSGTVTSASESAARTALERFAGTTFTDSEWLLHRDRLLAYVQLLRSWDANRGPDRPSFSSGGGGDRSSPPGEIASHKPHTPCTS